MLIPDHRDVELDDEIATSVTFNQGKVEHMMASANQVVKKAETVLTLWLTFDIE